MRLHFILLFLLLSESSKKKKSQPEFVCNLWIISYFRIGKRRSQWTGNTYCKLLLELCIVIGTQILYMLQERLLVDRPDRDGRREIH